MSRIARILSRVAGDAGLGHVHPHQLRHTFAAQAVRRMLGNGWCTRPQKLDCAFETIGEGCGFFQTTIAFRDTLQTQHDDAVTKGQDGRAKLMANLLDSPAARAAG